MEQKLEKLKLYRLINSAYIVSIIFCIGVIIAFSIFILGIALAGSSISDAIGYSNVDIFNYLVTFICFGFLVFTLVFNKSAHRNKLVAIAFMVYAATGLLSITYNSTPLFILGILDYISFFLLSFFLFRKTKNKTILPVWINAIFIAFIATNIGNFIFAVINLSVQENHSIFSVIWGSVSAGIVVLFFLFLVFIPFKALKDKGFYKSYIETHPKYFLKNKKNRY
jgi:hypothetical protein